MSSRVTGAAKKEKNKTFLQQTEKDRASQGEVWGEKKKETTCAHLSPTAFRETGEEPKMRRDGLHFIVQRRQTSIRPEEQEKKKKKKGTSSKRTCDYLFKYPSKFQGRSNNPSLVAKVRGFKKKKKPGRPFAANYLWKKWGTGKRGPNTRPLEPEKRETAQDDQNRNTPITRQKHKAGILSDIYSRSERGS